MRSFSQILREYIITKNKQNPSILIKAKKFANDPTVHGHEMLLSELNNWIKKINKRIPFFEKNWTFEIHDPDVGKFIPIEWHDLLKRYRLVTSD